ncbi:Hsp20/alpha crystallin family protein, partial [Bacillus sp. JJ722]|uniref:Hsp20/alpha crystallin family protein n=1 Tax=Bacillus sp. JJ722 TaxID=3122973 RepID=UPI0030006683
MQKNGYNNQANDTSSFFDQQSSDDYEDDEASIDVSIFETHSEVYVRIPIQDRSAMQNMKIYHTSNTSIVEGYPTEEDRHVFTLPSIVKKKGATAQYRDGTLEIRLAKATDLQYSEINVT